MDNNQKMLDKSDTFGVESYDYLVRGTAVYLQEVMDKNDVWSEFSTSMLEYLVSTDIFKSVFNATEVEKHELNGVKVDNFWYWFAKSCVDGVIATHYRIMKKSSLRTLYGTQSLNIGEIVASSLGFSGDDKSYNCLGEIALNAVVLGNSTVSLYKDKPTMNAGSIKSKFFGGGSLILAKNWLGESINAEKHPEHVCIGTSSFYLEWESSEDYYDTSKTIDYLFYIFFIVYERVKLVQSKEWFDSAGFSYDKNNKE